MNPINVVPTLSEITNRIQKLSPQQLILLNDFLQSVEEKETPVFSPEKERRLKALMDKHDGLLNRLAQ